MRKSRQILLGLIHRPLHIAALTLLVLICGGSLLMLQGSQSADAGAAGGSYPSLSLSAGDRILVLSPHPDDEVLGCGGVLQEAASAGIPYRVVFLTNGDFNQWSFLVYRKRPELLPGQVKAMGEVRQREAIAAGKALGLAPSTEVFLGFPDFGTLPIWLAHWGTSAPYRSLLTRATEVPYQNTLRPAAPYKGEPILNEIESEIRDFRPTKIFVSHPADYNSDHQALYVFTRVALWDLEQQPDWIAPELYGYLVHYPHWPAAKGPIAPPGRLAVVGSWFQHTLTPGEVERKRAALAEHATQVRSNFNYLESFIRPNELYGDLPEVALRLPPRQTMTPPVSASQPPDELDDSEQALFIGLESRTIRLDGEHIVVTLHLSRPLARGVSAEVYLFGYRRDRSFADMPKVHIAVGELLTNAHDQRRPLPQTSWQVERRSSDIIVRVPLSAVGDPQRILTGARTYAGQLPLSTLAWRVLDVETR
ncbi:MAG TPA: PIG-L family deacetylase [Anaerolineae bacterium]